MDSPRQVCCVCFLLPLPASLTAASSAKLSLSTTGTDGKDGGAARVDLPRSHPSKSNARSNPFSAISPLSGSGVSSPSTNASSAFGLGSGAFASFGAPKTPGEKRDGEQDQSAEGLRSKPAAPQSFPTPVPGPREHPLKSTWVIWYRPPTPKYSDYEKSTVPLASISSVENFWTVYSHLKRPSLLPTVSDYHIFRKGVRPVWEDEANKRGGKWVVRLKKGVADRYWEDLLLAIIGDQFAEASDEVCGAVLSVRSGEDVLNVWTRIDGGRNVKIRYVFGLALVHGIWLMCAGKPSNACLPSLQTPTLYGRATTIALPNARPSIKPARRKLRPTTTTTNTITTNNSAGIDEGLRRMTSLAIKEKRRRLENLCLSTKPVYGPV